MKHVECAEILGDIGLTPSAPRNGMTMLKDQADQPAFMVPVDIDVRALLSIIDYGGREYNRGRERVKADLLALIGAQPARPQVRQ
jgi:hypothetical protein